MFRVLFLAVLAGIAYSLSGVAYRFGAKGRLNSRQVLFPVTVLSCLVFFRRGCLEDASWQFLALAAGAGAAQYFMVFFFQLALRRGPLTPMWCALMLCFVPVILYAGVFLKEPVTPFQVGSIVLAAAAVIAAAYSNSKTPEASDPKVDAAAPERKRRKISLVYVVILLMLPALNGFSNIALKTASAMPEYKGAENLYMTVFFGMPAVLIFLEFLFTRGWPRLSRYLAVSTLLGAGGNSLGMWLLSLAVTAPAALVFTALNTASILSAGILSVTFFGEKRTPAWYWMVVLSVGAIVLSNLK